MSLPTPPNASGRGGGGVKRPPAPLRQQNRMVSIIVDRSRRGTDVSGADRTPFYTASSLHRPVSRGLWTVVKVDGCTKGSRKCFREG